MKTNISSLFVHYKLKMKIFIVGSDVKSDIISHEIAKLLERRLRLALPNQFVINRNEIMPGHREDFTLAKVVNGTKIGVLCLTKKNQEDSELLFLAGALSQADGIDTRIIPLCIDFEPESGHLRPAYQDFSRVAADSDGMKQIINSILDLGEKSKAINLSRQQVKDAHERFEEGVGKLVKRIDEIIGYDPREQKLAWMYDENATRYGMGYDDLFVKLDLLEDGSALLTRTLQVRAFGKIERIKTYVLVDRSEEEVFIENIPLQNNRSNSVSFREISVTKNSKHFQVKFNPPLENEEVHEYTLCEKIAPLKNDPWSGMSWNINRPTRRFALEVNFPPNCTFSEPNINVTYVGADGGIEDIQDIVEPEIGYCILSKEVLRLRLEVDFPMHGLMYQILWKNFSLS